jgi:hypothetical protein
VPIPDSEKYLGRVIPSVGTYTTETDVLRENPARVVARFSLNTTAVTMTLKGYVAGQLACVVSVAAFGTQVFKWSDDGPLVGARWTVQISGTGGSIAAWEVVYVG